MNRINGKAKLAEVEGKVQNALNLLDQDEAEEIIGEPGAQYEVLVQGVEAAVAMSWAVLKSQGVRQNQQRLKTVSQMLVMLLQIIHFAYALGVREGNSRAAQD